jgi:hypothetical protein
MRNGNVIDYTEEQRIRELLLFRKVVKAENDTLYLDNGTELRIIPNSGCGGCSAGNYQLTELNTTDNAITNVEFTCEDIGDYEQSYKIFVFQEDKKMRIVQVDGSDGNGYYGNGYEIEVKIKENK